MISWGISANSHDAALAVFNRNDLVFASHSERFSGIKNDRNLCSSLIDYAKDFGLPETVYWYENPWKKTFRQLFAGQGWKLKDNNIKQYLANYRVHAPIVYSDHHLSHAAGAYFTSSFTEACILVIDAIGEFETLTIWLARGNKLKKLYSKSYPHSIGLFYSAMTQRVGLKPNEDEYILLGMAAYGDTSFKDKIEIDFIKNYNTFSFKKNLHRGCLDWEQETPVSKYFDIACATQKIYESLFRNAIKLAKKLVKVDNLVLTGGCALNCSANSIAHEYFDNVWIMPNPGDAGSAIGSVLAKQNNHIEWKGPYLGYDMGYISAEEEIVDYLVNNKICGVARGKAEFGPRAFGNRSLLADPRDNTIKDTVNKIKQRQEFRPFAPIVLLEWADKIFDIQSKDNRYMQYTAKCKYPDLYPGIVHKDGTSRIQTIGLNNGDCPKVRKLLTLWYERTGCPVLLNTSLNIKGKPIVNDHKDAKEFSEKYGIKVFT